MTKRSTVARNMGMSRESSIMVRSTSSTAVGPSATIDLVAVTVQLLTLEEDEAYPDVVFDAMVVALSGRIVLDGRQSGTGRLKRIMLNWDQFRHLLHSQIFAGSRWIRHIPIPIGSLTSASRCTSP